MTILQYCDAKKHTTASKQNRKKDACWRCDTHLFTTQRRNEEIYETRRRNHIITGYLPKCTHR